MEYAPDSKKAKFRFIALYALALVLIFVVVSSFWKKRVDDVKEAKVTDAIQVTDNTTPEVENLKRTLAEKEQKIAALESAVQQKSMGDTAAKLNPPSANADGKDKMIASLQNQLKEKEAALRSVNSAPAVTTTPSDGSEWKQKYASLKASYDKVSANEKTLKSAYKTVADDNKRLLSQLQTMKKN
jgi:hypothetical protein